MRINRANRTVELERKDCHCGDGTVATRKDCPKCQGTGNGPRGGKGGCRGCHGSGNFYDHEDRSVCQTCDGDFVDAESEGWTDYFKGQELYDELAELMPVVVYRSDRPTSWNEQYLGHGCVWSTTDYGDHHNLTDDELIDKVLNYRGQPNGMFNNQACKFADKTEDEDILALRGHVGIFCGRSGYSVRAVNDVVETVKEIASEKSYDEVHGGSGFYSDVG